MAGQKWSERPEYAGTVHGNLELMVLDPQQPNASERNFRTLLGKIRDFVTGGMPIPPPDTEWVTMPTVTNDPANPFKFDVNAAGVANFPEAQGQNFGATSYTVEPAGQGLEYVFLIYAKPDGTYGTVSGPQSQNPAVPPYPTTALYVSHATITETGGTVEEPVGFITESRVLELLAESFVDTVENGNMKGVTSNAVYNHPLFEEWVNNVHYPPDYPRVLSVQLGWGTHLLFKRTSLPLAESPAFPGTGTYIHPVEEDTLRQYYSLYTPRSVQPFPVQGGLVADSTILYEGGLVALQLEQTSYSPGMTLQAQLGERPASYIVLSGGFPGSPAPTTPVALTDAATLTVDLALSDKFTLAKGSNNTQLAFANPANSKEFALFITGANGTTISFPTGYTHYMGGITAGSVTLPASGNAILHGVIIGSSVWWALEASGGSTGPTLGTGALAVNSGAMGVPMTSDGVYYAASYPTSITVDTTGNSLGRGVVVKIVANGTTAPTVAGATRHNSSANFNTTNGTSNTLRVWCEYNASNVKTNYYIWTQQ